MVRNASNALVVSAPVGVRVSILQGSATGNGVYVETQMPSTNANGLITLNIGDGNVVFGSFDGMDWSAGSFFLKTEIDPNGGNDYSVTSIQQLMSVPYALYAKEAGNGFSGDYNDLTNLPQIPQIPADVSAFNNDVGYLTSFTEQQVLTISNDTLFLTGGSFVKLPAGFDGDYNSLTNKPLIPTNVGELTNDANYITLADVPDIPSNVSAFANDAGYITEGELQQTVAVLNTTFESVDNTMDSLRDRINELEGNNTPPTVMTTGVANVSYLSATVNGSVVYIGGALVAAKGFCYATTPDPEMSDSHVHAGNGTGVFTAVITGLDPESTYYVRAYALNEYGVSYSSSLTVTTLVPTSPVVTTDSVSMYNECMATVVSDGGANVTARGFCYDTLPNPTLENGVVYVDGGEGEFAATLSGLPIGKLYFVRAFATNTKGTTYGNQFDFYGGCDMKTLTDYDGNVYNTVLIGSQCWMKENLKTTHYSDGWPIEHGSSLSVGEMYVDFLYDYVHDAYYYYPGNNNSIENVDDYGLLYNAKALMRESSLSDSVPSGVQGVCPEGWHVPIRAEWEVLSAYVNSQAEYLCSGYSNKAVADSIGWASNDEACSPGYNPLDNNSSGFSARPAGVYSGSSYANGYATFWSSTLYCYIYGKITLAVWEFGNNKSNPVITNVDARQGRSVRCLRD